MSVDYSKVDWKKFDAEIARELGVTRQAVGQVRRRLGKPLSKKKKIVKNAHQTRKAFECCAMVKALYAKGIQDVLPDWMHGTWDALYDLSREALEDNSPYQKADHPEE